MDRHLSGKVGEPVPKVRMGQRRTGPAPLFLTLLEVNSDRFLRAANTAEVGVWSKGDDVFALRAPIALEIQTASKSAKVPGSKAMPPDLVVPAGGTYLGLHPRIVLALLKNILEQNGDKIYHWNPQRGA